MKISIIGGGGRVGSNAAFAFQCASIVSEIHLLDANEQMAAGEALDLIHGTSVAGDQKIYAGNYEKCSDSDMVVITAGLRRKPDESRLDLINRNVSLFKQILDSLKTAGLKKDAIVFVVSNPVDVLTRLAIDYLKWDPARTIGLGTQLDTARFRSLIAEEIKLPPSQVKAMILGEHGDSMVPIWSSATVGGMPLEKYPGWTNNIANEVFQRTKGSGAEVISKKGGAGFAVGIAIRDVIHAIALDQRRVLPVSTVQDRCYDIRDVALSVPTVVGRAGCVARHAIELWPKEVQLLRKSGLVLRQTLETVLGRIGRIRK